MYEDLKANRRDFENQPGPPAELPFALVLSRSTDGGRTFSAGTEFETDVLATRRFLPFLPELPQLAASPDGKLYATWADGRDGDDDVFLRRSTDGGATWDDPVKVNDNGADGTAQFLPKVDVGPGERVNVLFLDGRNDRDKKELLDAYLATSTDGGRSFQNIRLSTRSFLEEIGPSFGPDYGTDFGTRLGLAHAGSTLYAAWTDTSAGSPATGRQDVNSTTVDLPSSGGRSVIIGILVLLFLLGGGLGLLLSRRNRGAPSPRTDAQNRQVVTS
jgi:prepilin-type processing-associated H-X9-DG protein